MDAGDSGIYVWVGKKSTKEEKAEALKKGEKYLADNKYPSWTKVSTIELTSNFQPTLNTGKMCELRLTITHFVVISFISPVFQITRVVESAEPAAFRAYFGDWRN